MSGQTGTGTDTSIVDTPQFINDELQYLYQISDESDHTYIDCFKDAGGEVSVGDLYINYMQAFAKYVEQVYEWCKDKQETLWTEEWAELEWNTEWEKEYNSLTTVSDRFKLLQNIVQSFSNNVENTNCNRDVELELTETCATFFSRYSDESGHSKHIISLVKVNIITPTTGTDYNQV